MRLHKSSGTKTVIFQSPAGLPAAGCVPARRGCLPTCREILPDQPTSRCRNSLVRWISGQLRPPFSSSTYPLSNHRSTFFQKVSGLKDMSPQSWLLETGFLYLENFPEPRIAYLSSQLPAAFPATSDDFPAK